MVSKDEMKENIISRLKKEMVIKDEEENRSLYTVRQQQNTNSEHKTTKNKPFKQKAFKHKTKHKPKILVEVSSKQM